MKLQTPKLFVWLIILGLGYGCKVKSSGKVATNWKAFNKQQSEFEKLSTEKLPLLDSVINKLKLKPGMRVIDYGVFHGQFANRLLKKEAEVLGLHWNLPEVTSPEARFPQPWPSEFPGKITLKKWQSGKITTDEFDFLIVQGRIDELSPSFPEIINQNIGQNGGILFVNFKNLPQIGEAYCQGNTLTKPFIETIENAGFQQAWEIKSAGIHYLFMKRKSTN